MEKKKNMYYGVSVDGLMLKVAEIEDNKGQLILHRIQSYKLTKPLYTDFSDVSNMGGEDSPNVRITSATDVDLEADVDDIDILSDSYGTELNDFDDTDGGGATPTRGAGDPTVRTNIRESSAQADAVYQFLGNFLFDSGKISLSCIDGKVQWKQFRMSKKASTSELKKRVLSDYQIKDPNCHIDFMEHPDFNYTAIIHQGDFELMSLMDRAAQMSFNSRKGFYYQFIEPIEVSMLNIFNIFYANEIGKYTTLLYIGEESKVGLVIKNKEIVKMFPLMVAGRDPEKIREAVMAKLLLEQENSDCPIIENIVLAGVYATKDDIDFYNKKTGNSHKLFELDTYEMKKYKVDFRIAGAIAPSDIPAYIVPISLALHGAMAKNKEMNSFNLLPKRIIEDHNPFNLKWYGILLVILIIIALIVGNNILITNTNKLADVTKKYIIASSELKEKEDYYNQLTYQQTRISELEEANAETVNIASKNSWHITLGKLADFAYRNPMVWIENVSINRDTQIVLRGKSVQRERITNLTGIFPDGHITRISESQIADHDVWDFDINFPRPLDREVNHITLPLYLQSYENFVEYIQSQIKLDSDPTKQPVVEEKEPEVITPPTTEPIAVAPTPTRAPAPTPTPTPTPAPTTTPAPTPTPTPTQPTVRDKDGVEFDEYNNPKLLYDLARDSYLGNNFTEAITKLDIYVSKFPNGDEIALVYYLLGEINYVLNNFESAVTNFDHVYKLKRDKIAESLFFTSKSYEGMFDYDKAKQYYSILINEYPSNPLAKTANEQLKILNGEYQ